MGSSKPLSFLSVQARNQKGAGILSPALACQNINCDACYLLTGVKEVREILNPVQGKSKPCTRGISDLLANCAPKSPLTNKRSGKQGLHSVESGFDSGPVSYVGGWFCCWLLPCYRSFSEFPGFPSSKLVFLDSLDNVL